MTNTTHNGWANYETWNFNLWEGDYLQEVVNELKDDNETELDYGQVHGIVEGHIDFMLDEIDENDETQGFLSDAIGHAIQQIDIHEIVMHLLEV